MRENEYRECLECYLRFKKISEAYIMRKLRVTWDKAKQIIKSFFHYIDNNPKWRTVKSFNL